MSADFSVSTIQPTRAFTDILVVLVTQGKPAAGMLPARVARAIRADLKRLGFTGSWGSAELFVAPAGLRARFVGVVGLGKADASLPKQMEGVRRGVGKIVQDARRHMLRSLAVEAHGLPSAPSLIGAATEAADIADYRFTAYGKRHARQQASRSLRSVGFLVDRDQLADVRKAIRDAKEVLKGVKLTRDLVNQPAAAMSPEKLVDVARDVSKKSPAISLKVLGRREAAKEGFNAFLAVARGSSQEPYVIHLTYHPVGKPTKKVFLVGKGITFDSGGLSIKPSDGMETMKIDMAGAATVLGVFSVLPALKLPIEVHGVIAACENMPSGNAYRPGDILRAKNGKTIEVLSTDAEGRITLADALSYAAEHKPDAMIDCATLTGACMVALGESHGGLWSNDTQISDAFVASAEATGERVVAMPLPEEYQPFIESKIADVRNISTTRFGGAITAALFLKEFVGNTPWAHLDFAAPVYTERSVLPYWAHGATGYGVRTLVEFLRTFDSQSQNVKLKSQK